CGTSLSAVAQLANRIDGGEIDCAIAGGADSASDVPLTYTRNLQRTVLSLSRGKSWTDKLRTIGDLRPWDLPPPHPGVGEPGAGLCGTAHARSRAAEAAGLRHLRDPRSVRCAGALHAEGLGIGELLPQSPRAKRGAWRDRSREAQSHGLERRARPSVRGHRRA